MIKIDKFAFNKIRFSLNYKIHEIFFFLIRELFVLVFFYKVYKRKCSQLKEKMGAKRLKKLVSSKLVNKFLGILYFQIFQI